GRAVGWRHDDRNAGARSRDNAATADEPGTAELADEPPHLRRAALLAARAHQQGQRYNEATPLAEDGFLYITDSWGVLYKIDGRSGDSGRIVWRMDPKQERPATNRGATFW